MAPCCRPLGIGLADCAGLEGIDEYAQQPVKIGLPQREGQARRSSPPIASRDDLAASIPPSRAGWLDAVTATGSLFAGKAAGLIVCRLRGRATAADHEFSI